MMIRKGPYGYFAAEEITDPENISEYALGIIENDKSGHLLPAYINRTFAGTEISFDFSGLEPVDCYDCKENKHTTHQLSSRRRSVGGLLLSIHHLIDMLMNPALAVLDPKLIFTDDSTSCVKICCLPLMTDTPNRLSSINTHDLERLLRSAFFSEVLTEDEITRLIYSVQNNDEALFISTSSSITDTPLAAEQDTKINDTLIYILLMSLLSLLIFFMNTSLSLILAAAAAVFLMIELRTYRIRSDKKADKKDDGSSLILFDDSAGHGLNCAFLESYEPVDGAVIRYAVYQDLTTIGSDRFLSDLFINSDHVSPIHAQIILTDDTVYLSDCSSDNSTFIDDKRITPEIKHEVKSGQKITFGDIDFGITISFGQQERMEKMERWK